MRPPSHIPEADTMMHGSLNWLRCAVCDNVYLNPVGAIAYLSFLLGDDAERQKREDPWLEELERGVTILAEALA